MMGWQFIAGAVLIIIVQGIVAYIWRDK